MNETSAHPAVDATAPPPEPAKPQHVKREAGQRWRGKISGAVFTLVSLDAAGSWSVEEDPHHLLVDAALTEHWSLLAPAPAAIPAAPKVERAGCELYCGMTVSTLWLLPHGDPVERSWRLHRDTVGDGTRHWCSRSCMGAALPPLSAPKVDERATCKAWCGLPYITYGVPTEWASESERRGWPLVLGSYRHTREKETMSDPCWCSPACRDRRYPPLSAPKAIEAAKPATVAPATPKCGNNGCKTPYQNVAQRWCTRLNEYAKVGADLEWSCEPCHLLDEAEFTQGMSFETTGESNVLSNPDVPALIDRRLSHVANCHDDDLVGP